MYASHPTRQGQGKSSSSSSPSSSSVTLSTSNVATAAVVLSFVLIGSIVLVGDTSGFGGKARLGGFTMMGGGSPRDDPCRSKEGAREPAPVTDARLALVTGGAGFIGSNLVEMLLKLGFKVRVFDNLSTGFKEYVPTDDERVEFVEGDVREYAAVEKAVEGVAVVFHLAAMSKVAPSLKDPSMVNFCLENNVIGTDNVLRASLAAKVGKVVYAAGSVGRPLTRFFV